MHFLSSTSLYSNLPRVSFWRLQGRGHKSVPLFSMACPLPLIQSPSLCSWCSFIQFDSYLINLFAVPLTWGRSGGCWRAVRPGWTMKPFPTQHSSSSLQINCGELEINPRYLPFLRGKKNPCRHKQQSMRRKWRMSGKITFPGSEGRGEPRSGAWEPFLNLAFITSKQKVLKECPLWLTLSSKPWEKWRLFLSPAARSQAVLWGLQVPQLHSQDVGLCGRNSPASPVSRPSWDSACHTQALSCRAIPLSSPSLVCFINGRVICRRD